jgi:hypothetical protein
MVRLRSGAELPMRSGGSWKVTATFSLDTGAKKLVRCVRVRHGVGPSYYFTKERFDALFEPNQER